MVGLVRSEEVALFQPPQRLFRTGAKDSALLVGPPTLRLSLELTLSGSLWVAITLIR